MTPVEAVSGAETAREARADVLFRENQDRTFRQTDRLFLALMIVQWVVAIVVAVLLSPYAWEGKVRAVHAHVYAATLLGGLISAFPIALILARPGEAVTRHTVACAQMLWSALLVHLSGGRIETHFHVFVSLAFLAFYRDWKVLVPATVVVASDHLLRQIFWPESVYGILSPEWWRFLEHAGWVVFEDIVLVLLCLRSVDEAWTVARRRAEAEELAARELRMRAEALVQAKAELEKSQESLVRAEKLAAVGQLAASVGHELRNPLMAVRNANSYLAKRVLEPPEGAAPAATDPRVKKFFEVVDRELVVSSKILSDLLDFARERDPVLAPCPLRPLVADALAVVNVGGRTVELKNEVPDDLPPPSADADQVRQIVVNLVQNAVEAMPPEKKGTVTVRAESAGPSWRLTIADDGVGIKPEIRDRIFEPLFTTKTKGTGLGLAIVASVVRRHGGKIDIDTEVGRGTTFRLEFPLAPKNAAAPPAPALSASS
jgi:signal transduction histidine kinase